MGNIADLSDARVKFNRANEHLDALKAETSHWLKPYTEAAPIYFGRDGEWHTIYSVPVGIAADPRAGAIAGDFINNLRCVLDYLVRQAVLREGEKPDRRHCFPLYQSRDQFEREVKFRKSKRQESPLFGIPIDGDAWAVIENAQPFIRTPDNPFLDHLAVLQRLSNSDKHRTLPPQIPFPSQSRLLDVVGWSDEVTLIEQKVVVQPLSLEGPTELTRFRFMPADKDPGMHMKGKVGLSPTIGDVGANAGPDGLIRVTQATIFGATNEMVAAVRGVCEALAVLPRVIGWWPRRHDNTSGSETIGSVVPDSQPGGP